MSGLAVEVCDGCSVRISQTCISGVGVRFVVRPDVLVVQRAPVQRSGVFTASVPIVQDGATVGYQFVGPVAVTYTDSGNVFERPDEPLPTATAVSAPAVPDSECRFALPEGVCIWQVHATCTSEAIVDPGAPLKNAFRAIATYAGRVYLPQASFVRLVLGASRNGEVHCQEIVARELCVRAIDNGVVNAGLCTSKASCHASSRATVSLKLGRDARITKKTGGAARVIDVRVLHTSSR